MVRLVVATLIIRGMLILLTQRSFIIMMYDLDSIDVKRNNSSVPAACRYSTIALAKPRGRIYMLPGLSTRSERDILFDTCLSRILEYTERLYASQFNFAKLFDPISSFVKRHLFRLTSREGLDLASFQSLFGEHN